MNTLRAKYLAAVGLSGLLIIGGALGLSPRSKAVEQAASASANSDEQASNDSSSRQVPALPVRQWKIGETFVYDLDTTRTTAISGGSQPSQVMSYKVVGTLSLTVIAREQNEIHLRADLVAKDVQVTPKSDVDAPSWLSNTFYFKALESGAIRSFLFAKNTPVDARMILRGLVDSFQFVSPRGDMADWGVMEIDNSGQYSAKYANEDGQNVEKTKGFYTQMRGPTGLTPMQRGASFTVLKSTANVAIGASGWPKQLTEDESLEVQTLDIRVRSGIKTAASLNSITMHPEWAGAFPADLESDTISEAAAMAASMKQADVNLVGGRSFAQISADLRADDKSARSRAQARMSALLRVNPAEAKNATKEILHGSADKNSKKRMIGALGAAGTPEAQHELATLLASDAAGHLRTDSAISLATTKHPTDETANALHRAMESREQDVANTATLASGNVIRQMNTDGTSDTADALQVLINKLANAQTDFEKKLCLEALGNSGDPRAFVAIAPYLSSSSVTLRAAATGALRFMPGAVADAAIIAGMADAEVTVRQEAVRTIGFRPVSSMLDAIDMLLKSEPKESIRLAILQGLQMQMLQEPSVVELIEWAQENDPASSVKSLAASILATHTTG